MKGPAPLLIFRVKFRAKFRVKLNKVRKTIRPLWPKSNPLLFYHGNYKKIQGIRPDRMPEELWTRFVTLYRKRRSWHPVPSLHGK